MTFRSAAPLPNQTRGRCGDDRDGRPRIRTRVLPSRSAPEAVTFRQLSANAAIYRDPVEFKNGVTIRLQELGESQSVEYSVGRCPLHEFRLEVTLSG